jgi:Domain of unknown function (DUF4926)/Protein of unknown function (DUF2281)
MLRFEESVMQPELLDIIEALVDIPEHHVQAGMQGTIVHCYPDNAFEIEFVNEQGETTALFPMRATQFIVVWKAATKTWLATEDHAAALIAHLSDEAKQEVLDFARFLYARKQRKQRSPEGNQPIPREETSA